MQLKPSGGVGRMTVDANDSPPGSRLFLVVPREADPRLLQTELFRFDGCEHVKVDAVAAKGICFAKYVTANTAHLVMEAIHRADCKLGPYKVKVFPAEPKDSSLRNAAHASLSPMPPQLHLPDSLYDSGPLPPGAHMNGGLGTDLFAMLGESAAFMGGPYAMPSSGGSLAPQSGASAPAAPQSSSNMWSPPHSLHPISGSSMGGGAVASGQGVSMHDCPLPGLHVSHQLLMAQQDAHNRSQPAASQGQGPIFDSNTAGQQLAQLFAKLQTRDEASAANAPRMSNNMGSSHSHAYRMMPPGAQIGDSNARQMWQDSPHMHPSQHAPGSSLGHQSPYNGVGILGDLGSNSTTGPGLGSGGVVGSAGGSFSSQNGAYTHGMAAYPDRFPSRSLSAGMGYPSDGVVSSSSTPDNMFGYAGWQNAPGSGRTGSPAQSAGPGGSGLGPAPEVSMQRLFVVVSKSATEEQIAKQFKKFGGMEYCNLKRDKKTGQSKGYCFVNYSTSESAAAAMKALNGMEFPTGSGRNMKVIYSEVLQSNRQAGTSNRGPGSQQNGMPGPGLSGQPAPGPLLPKSHDFDCVGPGGYPRIPSGQAAMYHRSRDVCSLPRSGHSGPPSQEAPSLGGSLGLPGQHRQPVNGSHTLFEGNFADFVAAHHVDNSRGLLSIPSGPAPIPPPRATPPPAAVPVHGRPHHSLSPTPRPPQPRDHPQQPPPPPPPQPQQPVVAPSPLLCDPTVLLVHITRPLPEYALQHQFSEYGTVTSVKLLEEDGCYAMVRLEDAGAAAQAAAGLNKNHICGMTLTVENSLCASGGSSHYPSSRGPSSHGLSSTGSMQTAVPFAGMMSAAGMPHYLDRSKHQRNSSDLSGIMGASYIAPPHVSMHAGHAQAPGMAPIQSPHWHENGIRLVDATGLDAMHARNAPRMHLSPGGHLPPGVPPAPGHPPSPGRPLSWDSSSSPAP